MAEAWTSKGSALYDAGGQYEATPLASGGLCSCEESPATTRIICRELDGKTYRADVCSDCLFNIRRECVDPDPLWHPSDELTGEQISKISDASRRGEFYAVPQRWFPVPEALAHA